ncbi:MAG TPA: pirin family protein [Vicinamibacteria bacterium]|nr:pirin family protein [Vicinamibacteria bacterium]
MRTRKTVKIVRAQEAMEGAGVRIRRSLGTYALDYHDPFLLLDEFKSEEGSDYAAGFPDHPHRGFETVTYMLAGSMRHEDHKGNRGELGPGSVQWMTAGRGIIHSEMPLQEEGLMWGFQLWVNLPAKSKMTAPRYQDIPAASIPEVEAEGGVSIRVIAGEAAGTRGPVEGIATSPLYLDVRVPAGADYEHRLPSEHNALLYVYEGAGEVGGERVEAGELAVLSRDGEDSVRLAASNRPMRALLLAARPLGEPLARYGPFVMNTRAEIEQAFEDYRRGRLLD